MALLLRQRKFVSAYVRLGVGYKAAIAAGYAETNAEDTASDLLKNPEVFRAIEQAKARHIEKLDLKAEDALLNLWQAALSDPRLLVKDDGTPVPLQELDDANAAALEGVEIDTVAGTFKYRFARSKNRELLLRHLGMLRDKVELSVGKSLEDLLRESFEVARGGR